MQYFAIYMQYFRFAILKFTKKSIDTLELPSQTWKIFTVSNIFGILL